MTRSITIGLCAVMSFAGTTLAIAPAAPPPTIELELADDLADHLADVRAELATIRREIEMQAKERAVVTRVIELASADLEKADNDREARRIRKIVEQYRERLERIERDRVQLEEHRAQLVAAMTELEPLSAAAEGERWVRDAAEAAAKRDERIRELTARLESLREGAGDPNDVTRERQIAINQIEALRLALPALHEADRHDLAERIEAAIRLREWTLEGRGDAARALRAEAPDREELRELLGLAAEWWQAQGHEGRAETIARMTEALWSRDGRRDKGKGRDRGPALIERIESLQEHLEQVHAMVEAMYEELADVKRAVVEGR